MFDAVARRYDLVNGVMSMGRDRAWRRAVAGALALAPGERVLDLAAGTGTSSRVFTAAGAYCAACDFSLGMLRVGARRMAPGYTPAVGGLRFLAGDALRLPFRDEAFDAVTISFGLRNVADPKAALAEMLRVTRPGGRLVICESGHPSSRVTNALYSRYLSVALPATGRLFSSAPDAYSYLAESIKDWPAAPELCRWIAGAGWTGVRWRGLMFGAIALHAARRPG